MWSLATWQAVLVRGAFTALVALLYYLLLRSGVTTAKVNSATGAVLALTIIWLVNVEGAGKLAFLGVEIDSRVAAAEELLARLSSLESRALALSDTLRARQVRAAITESELRRVQEEVGDLAGIETAKYQAMYGRRPAFMRLSNFQSSDSSLLARAQAAVLEVKSFYLTATMVGQREALFYRPPGGQRIYGEQYDSGRLIWVLRESAGWRQRARAARILGDRREQSVPVVLLSAMESDSNLWVRTEALRAFERVTGYQSMEVFDFETDAPREWFSQNEDSILVSLKGGR